MRSLTILLISALCACLLSFNKVDKLIVTSTSFASNGMIPVKYTCLDQGTNPPLDIANIPPGTQSLAIVVEDKDGTTKFIVPKKAAAAHKRHKARMQKLQPADSVAIVPGYTHWVLWNIDVYKRIPENFSGDNVGVNSNGEHKYAPLCPQSGTHHYHFIVYALDIKLNLNKDAGKAKLERVMAGHILARGELVGWANKVYK